MTTKEPGRGSANDCLDEELADLSMLVVIYLIIGMSEKRTRKVSVELNPV